MCRHTTVFLVWWVGVTPASVTREILCEAGVDTLPQLWCSVAPCTWTLRTLVESLVDSSGLRLLL